MIRVSDWTNAAITIAWELSPDLVPDAYRRRVRAGVFLAGAGTLAWQEREELTATFDELKRSNELRERIHGARTEAELDAVVAEIETPEDGQSPSAIALTAAAVAAVGTIALEVSLRRRTKQRVAAGARYPRLPGALARGALALALGPLTRAIEAYDAQPA
ncbi:hypothetical protein [Nocardioides daejeonensis]|uniref:hypothetical protein n=1 Tax=Nocardioides daejeonensis TaxID=1046556 RepID=UPI000D74C513|nr:hypothetical protein [Nocardioides daejeonensis]